LRPGGGGFGGSALVVGSNLPPFFGGQVQGRGVRSRRVILRRGRFRRSVPPGWPPVLWGCR
jgi:hypothetical protein